ncbi:hypothetical protein AAGG91_002683 [Salmonella enterica]|nr:hypothetical protein [Salmonella enterica]WNV47537.1 hypothetical protein [Klebsiella phage fENko-Kae01]
MKIKDLRSMLEQHPDAEIVIQTTPYDDYSLGDCGTAHFYKAGDLVFERGESLTEFIDVELSTALVDIIVLS